MTDSDAREQLAAKHEENRAQRLASIKRWVDYIESQPPERWGQELNDLVNAQLESAQQTDLDFDQYRRVRDRQECDRPTEGPSDSSSNS